jgi:hypothetical protein
LIARITVSSFVTKAALVEIDRGNDDFAPG